jgi:hypothetical protein
LPIPALPMINALAFTVEHALPTSHQRTQFVFASDEWGQSPGLLCTHLILPSENAAEAGAPFSARVLGSLLSPVTQSQALQMGAHVGRYLGCRSLRLLSTSTLDQ